MRQGLQSKDAEVNSIEAAILIATAAHAGQKDKSGKPYILHPLRVMIDVYPNETAMKAAVLHDVVEDCDITLDDLREAGFDEDVIAVVDLLSRPGAETPNRPTHREYVERIRNSGNGTAIRVKLADTRDNLARIRDLPPEQQSLRDRYKQALKILEEP